MRYAGIGSRETPIAICSIMSRLAMSLKKKGHTLVTGGALGADSAFIKGDSTAELWLPFQGYNNFRSNNALPTANDRAFASNFHPNWKACSLTAQNMHARNCNIVLGPDLDNVKPVDFILCYTANGDIIGGTGQALRVAEKYNIKVFNLGDPQGVLTVLKNFKLFLENA